MCWGRRLLRREFSGTILLVAAVSLILAFSVRSELASGLPGDLNGNGEIDMDDLDIAGMALGSRPDCLRWNPQADLNLDGRVDMRDLRIIGRNIGNTLAYPIASFTVSADTVMVGVPITFDPSSSIDPDGMISLYEWDWENDGVYVEIANSSVVTSHTYMELGTYEVTLRVIDNDGLGNTTSTEIKVMPQNVISEVPLGTIATSALMITAIVAYFAYSRKRRRGNHQHLN